MMSARKQLQLFTTLTKKMKVKHACHRSKLLRSRKYICTFIFGDLRYIYIHILFDALRH